LWQFLSNTSRPLGLRKNRWIDERRNVKKSTEAAIRHLKHLHKRFNSWELALAAYNGGGGYLLRLMHKTGINNFWELKDKGLLKKETAEYVPRFIALTIIYKNQKLLGIAPEIEKSKMVETENFVLKKAVSINYLARLSGVSVKKIKELNPELTRGITPPGIKNYSIKLPTEGIEKLKSNRKKIYRYSYSYFIKYRVKSGDCISKIAKRYKKKVLL